MSGMNKSVARTLPGLLFGALALATAWPIAHITGLMPVLDWVSLYWPLARYPVLTAFYAAVMAGEYVAVRVAMLAFGFSLLGGIASLETLTTAVLRALQATWALVVRIGRTLIAAPLRLLFLARWKSLEDKVFDALKRYREEQRLREEYRRTYKDRFRDFAAFKRAFYGEDEKPDKAKPTGMSADGAFALFGLSPECTRSEFDAQHRKLIKRLHPDAGGTDALAALLTEAKQMIMKQKGWKK